MYYHLPPSKDNSETEICECGKAVFHNPKEAEREAKRLRHRKSARVHAYPCNHRRATWHVGSMDIDNHWQRAQRQQNTRNKQQDWR